SLYRERNEPVRVESCPLAHPSLFEQFGAAGYRVTEFTNVMAQRIGDAEPKQRTDAKAIEVRRVPAAEIDLWTRTVGTGFAEGQAPPEELLEVMKAFALAEGVECYLAQIDRRPAGGGTLILRDGVAGLFGAGTLPEFRKCGVQTELLRVRMERGREAGCDIAGCLAQPGSSSQRNVVRRGFQVLYTRVEFGREEVSVVFWNEIDDGLSGSAREKNFSDAGLLERGYIGFGNDTSDQYGDVVHAFFVQELHDLRADGVVRAGQNREANDVDVFL